MNSEAITYNTWHQSHALDDDVSTPWYEFVKSNLHESDIAEKNVLEIGCGRGGFSNHLVNNFPHSNQFFACDYSSSAIQIGKNNYGEGKIKWQEEDIMKLSFPDSFFDTIISCETIEHVPYPSKAVKELFRTLKPGGKLLLTCPNYFNLFGIWCLYRWLIRKPYTEGGQPYVNYILMPKLYWLIRKKGFIIEKFLSRDITIPARVPKHFFNNSKGVPTWLKIFGSRTCYVLYKQK